MLDTTLLTTIKKDLLSYADKRQKIIADANEALFHAKRAIFSIHRDDLPESKKRIDISQKKLRMIHTAYGKDYRALQEGAYKAALEEYVEAVCLYQFLTNGRIGKITGVKVSSEAYIAGLADVPGELYRYAIKAATAGDDETVRACATVAGSIVEALIECNLTSYLRNKFDQAKSAVHKLEQVVYELSLRGRV